MAYLQDKQYSTMPIREWRERDTKYTQSNNEWQFSKCGERSGQPDSRGPEDPIGRTWKGLHRHIIISQKLKTKRNFAAAGEKWHIICKSTAIRLWEDFSTETLQTKRV